MRSGLACTFPHDIVEQIRTWVVDKVVLFSINNYVVILYTNDMHPADHTQTKATVRLQHRGQMVYYLPDVFTNCLDTISAFLSLGTLSPKHSRTFSHNGGKMS